MSLAGAQRLGWTAEDTARLGAETLGDCYTSPAVLAAERQRVFAPSWALVASVEQVPAGHSVTAIVGGPRVHGSDAE